MLVATALKLGGLTSGSVGYVAVHGTGTPLGDPIEVGALAGVFSKQPAPPALGSVKVLPFNLL